MILAGLAVGGKSQLVGTLKAGGVGSGFRSPLGQGDALLEGGLLMKFTKLLVGPR